MQGVHISLLGNEYRHYEETDDEDASDFDVIDLESCAAFPRLQTLAVTIPNNLPWVTEMVNLSSAFQGDAVYCLSTPCSHVLQSQYALVKHTVWQKLYMSWLYCIALLLLMPRCILGRHILSLRQHWQHQGTSWPLSRLIPSFLFSCSFFYALGIMPCKILMPC